MSGLKPFRWYVETGVAKKISPNISRAKNLMQESERKESSLREILKKVGLSDSNANDIVEYCYDIIMMIVRAKLYIIGIKCSGTSSHEAEVSYLRELGFADADVRFADQLRFFRNGIKYYGKRIDSEYAKKTLDFLKKAYPKLKELIK